MCFRGEETRMKFNLKNRPKPIKYTAGLYAGFYKNMTVEDLEEWFEGFEKELRELNKAWNGIKEHGENAEPDLNIIRQILGIDK